MRIRGAGDRRLLITVGVAMVLATGPVAVAVAAPPTSSTTVPGSERAAAVQAVLDRVLGPGHAVVTISDTVATSTAATTTVRWGSAAPAASSVGVVQAGGTTVAKSVTVQNDVGGTTTSTVTPPGTLLHQSVAVAVDRAALGSTKVGAVRRLVAAAAGVVRSRGDSLSVVVTAFAKPVAVPAASAPTITALLAPYAVPGMWAAGGVLALLVLLLATRRRRPSTELARR